VAEGRSVSRGTSILQQRYQYSAFWGECLSGDIGTQMAEPFCTAVVLCAPWAQTKLQRNPVCLPGSFFP